MQYPFLSRIKTFTKPVIRAFNRRYADHSRLIPVGESMGWAIDRDIAELTQVWNAMGLRCLPAHYFSLCERQSVFLGSQFSILDPQFMESSHRLAIAYFHGLPEQGHEELDGNFRDFVTHRERFTRIQVSHAHMRKVLLDHGFDEEQVHRIPIGINPAYFRRRSKASSETSRVAYGVPQDAFVVGSFQKDGVGWEEGNEPKLIKGPDLFLKVMEELRPRIPKLFVLLSGPARGYVRNGLLELGIPHQHHFLKQPEEISRLYECLDAYLVASRDEGGPKAILESMISEVPLVSSRVGQAVDLIEDGRNAFLVDVEDVDAMRDRLLQIHENGPEIEAMAVAGYQNALQHAYGAQKELWRNFMKGFVES